MKISEYIDTNHYAKLMAVITEWRNYLGIKDVMTVEDIEFCTRFIKEEYSHFTLEKIKLAIKYSLRGELKVDIKPYGSFSPLYIATILNAYDKYDNKIVSELLREKDRQELQNRNKPVELTEEQKIKSRVEYLEYYQSKCQDEYLTDFNGVMWFVLNKKVDLSSYLTQEGYINLANFEMQKNADTFKHSYNNSKTFDEVVKYFVMKEHLILNNFVFSNFTKEMLF